MAERPSPQAPSPGPEPLALPAGVHQLCSCGRSRHGWLCDGAHLGTGRVSYELRLSQAAVAMTAASVPVDLARNVEELIADVDH